MADTQGFTFNLGIGVIPEIDAKKYPEVYNECARLRQAIRLVASALDVKEVSLQQEITNIQHNNLKGIQGGAVGDYYHLTAAEHTALAGSLDVAYYVPTVSNKINVGTHSVGSTYYRQIGRLIEVWGRIELDRLVSGTTTSVLLSLPIASNLGVVSSTTLLGLSVSAFGGQSASIFNDGTTNSAHIQFTATGTGTVSLNYQYSYILDTGIPSYTYATWNPADKSTGVVLSSGNLKVSLITTPDDGGNVRSTQGKSSGKWYWECTALSGFALIGIANSTMFLGPSTALGLDANGWGYYTNGQKYNSGTSSAYGATYTTGDIIGVALDMDAGTVTFYKNGVSQGIAFSGLTGTIYAATGNYTVAVDTVLANFGSSAFTYPVPSGFNPGLFT